VLNEYTRPTEGLTESRTGQALSVSQNVFEESRTTVHAEAAHFGLHSLDHRFSGTTGSDATLLKLIRYRKSLLKKTLRSVRYIQASLITQTDNDVICTGHSDSGQIPITLRRIAPLSPDIVQTLPPDFLNCVLGISAVHMAGRNSGNRQIQNLALEAKVKLFEGINSAFQQPQRQRADVLFACTTLMFAMDVGESHILAEALHFADVL